MQEMAELLIASVTPQNLERGALWFKENFDSIKRAQGSSPWWSNNALIIEKDRVIKLSEFLRRLANLGYERAQVVVGKGLVAVHGGVVELWPINTEKPYLVEFLGNTIVEIKERHDTAEKIKLRVPTRSIEKLASGSFVVHVDHGIGVFRGAQNEFFAVEYAPARIGGMPDMLYVPVDQKNRLSPYVGLETPRIHRLGGSVWQTTKRKVREDAEKLARELLLLYAKRALVRREPYRGDQSLEEEIRATFLYAETEDQLRAEEEIMKDLSGETPMDRVLCGDVGFGKTEVALRAALRAITSGKQVALLSPTTILAAQHEKTFRERLRNLPINVQMLSRLTPPREEKEILEDLKTEKIDVIIGTHRLFSKDVVFSAQGGSAPGGKNLGLVIIDEEQRFGVKQKERFKEMRSEIDILSLSATPIPRTLSLALAKLRDLSLIETPPPERLPITTNVLPHSRKIIGRAINFELERGGQIYFLHNRIETLGVIREKLRALKTKKPLRIAMMHGRMREKEILQAMDSFRERKCDLLLATTIIENGLDISSANTLIVDDATRLGLAEAHQLRGRIGRGATQAFAYFLYKPRHLTEKAGERLEALKEYSDLGAGYQIALRDLEIRGAGNILGREQSGAINKVGLNLYCQMLAEAIEEKQIK